MTENNYNDARPSVVPKVEVPKVPLAYCAKVQTGPTVGSFPLIMGLPDVHIPNACDEAIAALSALLSQLAFLSPLIRIIGCILKIVEVLKAVPGVVTNPGKIVSLLGELGNCVIMFTDFALISPTGAVTALKMIRGIIASLVKALACIVTMVEALVESVAHGEALSKHPDETFRAHGKCVLEQADAMKNSIEDRLKSIEGLVVLINVLLTVIGPIIGVDATIPSVSSLPADAEGIKQINAVITALETVLRVLPVK